MDLKNKSQKRRNPFKSVFDFKKEEIPVAVLMFFFFFFVIAIFQILRPLKKALFVDMYGADVELYAKLLNIVVAGLGVVVFTLLYNKLQRQRVIYIFCGFFIVCFIVLRYLLVDPEAVTVWAFYLIGDLITTLLVAAFWAYLTDISDSDQAKRLYGLIGAGGVVGGWVGISASKFVLFEKLGQGGLLFLASVVMLAVLFITMAVESLISRSKVYISAPPKKEKGEKKAEGGSKFSAVIEGAKLALRSKYLAAIVGIMAFYEIGSQILNYMFSKASEVLPGVTMTTSYYINVFFIANLVSVIVQIFLVSLIMRHFGLAVALCILPIAAAVSSGLYAAIPSLTAASLLVISDNGLNYSIQQTSREALYVPTSPDEKYKARAFTNMFVQRAAKGIAIGCVFLMTAVGISVRFMGIAAIAVFVVMAFLGIFDGRRFKQMTE